MVGQRYDPREMAHVFEMLDRQSAAAGGGKLPEWLSTHPNPGGRAEKAAQRAAGVHDLEGRRVDRETYLARLDGMVFGENPRQGFFRGSAFLHPDLKFRIDFPEGWKAQNTAAAVVAVSPQKDAAVQLVPAGKLSPEEARAKFFSQQGVKPLAAVAGPGRAAAAAFEANTEQGALRGMVSFVSHGGATYGLIGFTPAEKLEAYASTFERSFATFGPLNDAAALAVQPARIELVKVPRDMTIAEFMTAYPSGGAKPEEIALVNGLGPGDRLEAGRTAKRIVGGLPSGAGSTASGSPPR
jgi:predicted Zn-dependent protease